MIESANRISPFARTAAETKSSAAKTAQDSPPGGFSAELQATTAETESGAAAGTGTLNVFDRASVENHMNQWLIDLIGKQNAAKLANYQVALENWRLNDVRLRELGMPRPAPPEPPALDKAEAKPAGWWFETNV